MQLIPYSFFHFSRFLFRSDDEVLSQTSSAPSFSLALPDDVKKMKEYDGLGNIPLFPQFASDLIRPNALRLDADMDVTPWLKLKKKIMSRAKPDTIASAMYGFCRLLRRKFAGALAESSPAERSGSSDILIPTSAWSLWDSETIESLAKLWDISYNKSALILVATFFDRPGGPCPPADELATMSKPELSAYLASLGVPFMAPEYANGLILELIERRESPPLPADSSDSSPAAFTADLGAYQNAFARAVLAPSEEEFERAFERAFAAPEPIISSSSSASGAGEASQAAPKSFLSQFMARRVPAPPPKKFKSETIAPLPPPGATRPRVHQFDIRGTAESSSSVTLDVSPISGNSWNAASSGTFPSLHGSEPFPQASILSGLQVAYSTSSRHSPYPHSIGSFELHQQLVVFSPSELSAACCR